MNSNSRSGQLAQVISRIVSQCDEESINILTNMLQTSRVTPAQSILDWYNLIPIGLLPNHLLHELVLCFQSSKLSSFSLALAFQTALLSKQEAQQKFPKVELAWTGPYTPFIGGLRTTFSVFTEMITHARSSIYLVGYSVTASTESTQLIIKQLSDAKKRGCEVNIALHDDGLNRRNLLDVWPSSVDEPIWLKWRGKPGDNMASLHAKVLIVDQSELFVTSANLTQHGLESNIEIGARIQGMVAKQLFRHFTALVREGILEQV